MFQRIWTITAEWASAMKPGIPESPQSPSGGPCIQQCLDEVRHNGGAKVFGGHQPSVGSVHRMTKWNAKTESGYPLANLLQDSVLPHGKGLIKDHVHYLLLDFLTFSLAPRYN